MKDRRAVVLLSGGLDSAVAATLVKCERFDLYALTFDYGQRNRDRELEAAKKVGAALRVKEHKILTLPLDEIGGSALTDAKIAIPKGRSRSEIGEGVPITYVPARNTIFLSIALGYAETLGADAIAIGAHAVDYSGYPDCRPEFFDAFTALAKVATKQGVEEKPPRIMAPLLGWNKAKIIETGNDLKAPMKYTWSCYEAGKQPCGRCDACQLRAEAFSHAGVPDPALAAAKAPAR